MNDEITRSVEAELRRISALSEGELAADPDWRESMRLHHAPDAIGFTLSPAPIDHAEGACGVEYVHPLLDREGG